MTALRRLLRRLLARLFMSGPSAGVHLPGPQSGSTGTAERAERLWRERGRQGGPH